MSDIQGVNQVQQRVSQHEVIHADWTLGTKPLEFAVDVIDAVSAYLACQKHYIAVPLGFIWSMQDRSYSSLQLQPAEFTDATSVAQEMIRRENLLKQLAGRILFLGLVVLDARYPLNEYFPFDSLLPLSVGYRFCELVKNKFVPPSTVTTKTVTTVVESDAPVSDSASNSVQVESKPADKEEPTVAPQPTQETEKEESLACGTNLQAEEVACLEPAEDISELDEQKLDPVARLIVTDESETTVFEEV